MGTELVLTKNPPEARKSRGRRDDAGRAVVGHRRADHHHPRLGAERDERERRQEDGELRRRRREPDRAVAEHPEQREAELDERLGERPRDVVRAQVVEAAAHLVADDVRSAMNVRIDPDAITWQVRMKYMAPSRSCAPFCEASTLQ